MHFQEVPSLIRLQLSGNVNQRRYKKERKGMRRLEKHAIFFPVERRVGLGCCTVKIRNKN
jgi:hypothetical protein